ncbi:MAG TPA: hypothetical protein VFP84_05020 [Kofleriaceae bacterium]|nr:hypothetical protein [Kofleriaceae bacterium]
MRSLIKTLLTSAAVCAAAQATAFAQPTPAPAPAADPYVPTAAPAPVPADPNAAPPLPPPPVEGAVPVDAPVTTSTSTSTTTTTTTTTGNDLTLGYVPNDSYAWYDPRFSSGIGVSTTLGGGVAGFTDKAMRNATSDVGGLWDLRVSLGTRLPIGLDVSYVGSATNLRGLAGRNGTLIGTTVEAALRWNILPHAPFTPYIFGGAGWSRYDVTQNNTTLADSGMNPNDDLIEFPAGLGLSWRAYGFVADVRGTYRATLEQNLVLKNPVGVVAPNNSDNFAPMDSWEASAALGYEF